MNYRKIGFMCTVGLAGGGHGVAHTVPKSYLILHPTPPSVIMQKVMYQRYARPDTSQGPIMNRFDAELIGRIRRELVEDESLSIPAQNIKIISQDGLVTLRGRVQSVSERDKVISLAKAVGGEIQVLNELKIMQAE